VVLGFEILKKMSDPPFSLRPTQHLTNIHLFHLSDCKNLVCSVTEQVGLIC